MRKSGLAKAIILQALLLGCTENTSDQTNTQAGKQTSQRLADTLIVNPEVDPGELSDLFTYHNKLVVGKDLEIDVLGMGTPDNGNYLIVKSDKSRANYFSITGNKKGRILNSNVTDLDADHQIEVIVFTRNTQDSKGSLIMHEIDSMNNHTRITIPELGSGMEEGYQGRDTFYVKNNKIIREFPVSAEDEAAADKKRIEYVLQTNTLLPSAQGQEKQ